MLRKTYGVVVTQIVSDNRVHYEGYAYGHPDITFMRHRIDAGLRSARKRLQRRDHINAPTRLDEIAHQLAPNSAVLPVTVYVKEAS